MGASEKFCLRWNDFETNISVAFRELREEKDFFDVTLACDDSQIQAHKVILSACSPFFRNVLRKNPHQHPLLYLKGVKYKELLAVLNFMYMGEVNVAQEELNSFLAVAEDLRVKGLTQNNSDSSSDSKPKAEPKQSARSRDPPERESSGPPPKRPRPVAAPAPPPPSARQSTFEDDDIQEVVPVKSEPREPVTPSSTALTSTSQSEYHQDNNIVVDQAEGAVALEESYQDESYDYGNYEEGYDDGSGGMIDPNTGMPLAAGADGNKGRVIVEDLAELDNVIMSKVISVSPNCFQCTDCPKMAKTKQNLSTHIEAMHVYHPGFNCPSCQKLCSTRDALRKHKIRFHRTENFALPSVVTNVLID